MRMDPLLLIRMLQYNTVGIVKPESSKAVGICIYLWIKTYGYKPLCNSPNVHFGYPLEVGVICKVPSTSALTSLSYLGDSSDRILRL